MKLRPSMKHVWPAATAMAVSSQPALAQATDLFAAPTSFLTQVQAFVTGPSGILLGGAAIAVAGISAAAPRIPVTWGSFFVLLVVLTIFYGAFGIAEVVQGFST